MNIETLYGPESTVAKVNLEAGESIIAEAGAMICMSTNLKMETKSSHGEQKSGLLSKVAKVGKRMLAGESLFQNKFTAEGGPGEILLSQFLPGDLFITDIPDCGIYLQSSAFVGSTPDATVEGQLGGFKSFFGLGGIFILKATTSSPDQKLIFGSFGAIEEIECDGELVVDNGHLVAWEGSLTFTNTKAAEGGLIASYFSGEGIVCSFSGKGKIWIQSRQPIGFGKTLAPLLAEF